MGTRQQFSCDFDTELVIQLERALKLDRISKRKWTEAAAILYLGKRYRYGWEEKHRDTFEMRLYQYARKRSRDSVPRFQERVKVPIIREE